MVQQQRHPWIAALIVANLSGQPHIPFFRAARPHFILRVQVSRHPLITFSHMVFDQHPGNQKRLSQELSSAIGNTMHLLNGEARENPVVQSSVRSSEGLGAVSGGPGAGVAVTPLPTRRETTLPMWPSHRPCAHTREGPCQERNCAHEETCGASVADEMVWCCCKGVRCFFVGVARFCGGGRCMRWKDFHHAGLAAKVRFLDACWTTLFHSLSSKEKCNSFRHQKKMMVRLEQPLTLWCGLLVSS